MRHQRIDPKAPTYGSGFSRLRDLHGPDVFTTWFATRNRLRPRMADSVAGADHAGMLAAR